MSNELGVTCVSEDQPLMLAHDAEQVVSQRSVLAMPPGTLLRKSK
jgi:hypothetical protein